MAGSIRAQRESSAVFLGQTHLQELHRGLYSLDSGEPHSARTSKLSCHPGRRFTIPVNTSDSSSLTSDFKHFLCSQADIFRCDRQVITCNIQYSFKFHLIRFESNLVLQMTSSAALQKTEESLLSKDYFKGRGLQEALNCLPYL